MRWLLSFLVGFLIHAFAVLGGKTACSVPSVKELEETNLMCYFPEDVSKSKKDVTVYRFQYNKEKDVVVECLWHQGKLDCFTLPGYRFDRNITDRMKVQILRVTGNQTGKYACGLAGLKSDDFSFCELYLPSEQPACKLSEDHTLATNLTCKFPEDISKTEKGFVVLRYNNYENPVAVVDCLWHMNNLKCTAQPGYEPSTTATDSFTVQVLTSENKAESYQCYMFGSRPDQASICSFVSKGNVTPSDAAFPWHISTIVLILLIFFFGVTSLLFFKFRERLLICWNHLMESCLSENLHLSFEDVGTSKNHDKNISRIDMEEDVKDEDDESQPISLKDATSMNKDVPATELQDGETDHLLMANSNDLLISENSQILQVLPIIERSPEAETNDEGTRVVQCGLDIISGHSVAEIVGRQEKASDIRMTTAERKDVRQDERSNPQHNS